MKKKITIGEKKHNISANNIIYLQRQYGIEDWDIKGLWFGGRGTASKLIFDLSKLILCLVK